MSKLPVAVDLGAGSGRVMLGRLGDDGLLLQEVHRFTYPPAERNGHLRWDVEHIWSAIKDGLRAAQAPRRRASGPRSRASASIAGGSTTASWMRPASSSRSPRATATPKRTALMAEVLERVPRERMFARTGIQFLPFNTVYQLYAHVKRGNPARRSQGS